MPQRQSKVLGIRMPTHKMQALRDRANREGKTLSELGNELIARAIEFESMAK